MADIVYEKSNNGYTIAIHGDCIGGDAEFNDICMELGYRVICRPSTHQSRAHTRAEIIAQPVAPMIRNARIVWDADYMLACPYNYANIKRGSGTWNTIRIARRLNKPMTIIFPDGTTTHENLEE